MEVVHFTRLWDRHVPKSVLPPSGYNRPRTPAYLSSTIRPPWLLISVLSFVDSGLESTFALPDAVAAYTDALYPYSARALLIDSKA